MHTWKDERASVARRIYTLGAVAVSWRPALYMSLCCLMSSFCSLLSFSCFLLSAVYCLLPAVRCLLLMSFADDQCSNIIYIPGCYCLVVNLIWLSLWWRLQSPFQLKCVTCSFHDGLPVNPYHQYHHRHPCYCPYYHHLHRHHHHHHHFDHHKKRCQCSSKGSSLTVITSIIFLSRRRPSRLDLRARISPKKDATKECHFAHASVVMKNSYIYMSDMWSMYFERAFEVSTNGNAALTFVRPGAYCRN